MISHQVKDDGEISAMKWRAGRVDGSSRSNNIDNRYKLDKVRDTAIRDEKRYERKLDYRCEGDIDKYLNFFHSPLLDINLFLC